MELLHRDGGRRVEETRLLYLKSDLNQNQLLHRNREVSTKVELSGERE